MWIARNNILDKDLKIFTHKPTRNPDGYWEDLEVIKYDEELKGRWFYDEETGEKMFLPCAGYRIGAAVYNVSTFGYCWSSLCSDDNRAYYFSFNCRYVSSCNLISRYNGHSVHLVSDEPFEGAIHVAGLYWKPENEDGYYTWDDAIILKEKNDLEIYKFNK